jgi:hypothetical protein
MANWWKSWSNFLRWGFPLLIISNKLMFKVFYQIFEKLRYHIKFLVWPDSNYKIMASYIGSWKCSDNILKFWVRPNSNYKNGKLSLFINIYSSCCFFHLTNTCSSFFFSFTMNSIRIGPSWTVKAKFVKTQDHFVHFCCWVWHCFTLFYFFVTRTLFYLNPLFWRKCNLKLDQWLIKLW